MSGLDPETWKSYLEQASERQKQYVDQFNSQMDMLLLFAALFSAIVTAFVVVSYATLQPDLGQSTLQVLQEILVTLRSNESSSQNTQVPVSEPFTPAHSAVRVNMYWFIALVLSLCTAFLAILAKQWLLSLSGSLSADMETRGRQQQFRWDGVKDWQLSYIMAVLPLMLHISLALFFVGLVEFIWPVNTMIAIAVACLSGATVLFYVLTHILSILSPTCPYRTSTTDLVSCTFNMLAQEFLVNSMTAVIIAGLCSILALMSPFVAAAMVVSWVRRHTDNDRPEHERALRTTLQDLRRLVRFIGGPSRWRRATQSIWTWQASPMLSLRSAERDYIGDNSTLIDARALARMIGEFPRSEDSSALVKQLVDFGPLRERRSVFTRCGAVALLAQQLHSALAETTTGEPAQHAETLRISDALVQLLTEADADDRYTLLPAFDDVPVHHDLVLAIGTEYDYVDSLEGSGLCVADHAVAPHPDLAIFANMLRLHVLVSSDGWYSTDIGRSVDSFLDDLKDPATTATLGDDTLVTVIDTAIYIALRPVDGTGDGSNSSQEHPDLLARVLEVLTTVVTNRPDMSIPALRQACWGIWYCSRRQGEVIYKGGLVPVLKDMKRLIKPTVHLLSVVKARNPFTPMAVLALLEALLYPRTRSSITAEQEEERCQFASALAHAFATFLEDVGAALGSVSQKQSIPPLALTTRIVSTYSCIARSHTIEGRDPNIPQLDIEHMTASLLGLAHHLFEHAGDIPSVDQSTMIHVTIGAVCAIGSVLQTHTTDGAQSSTAMVRSGQAGEPHTDSGVYLFEVPRPVAIEEVTSEHIADSCAALLRSASYAPATDKTPRHLDILLSMIADLPTRFEKSASVTQLLAYLRDPARSVAKSLQRILQCTREYDQGPIVAALTAVRSPVPETAVQP